MKRLHKPRHRQAEGLFLIEGEQEIRLAAEAGVVIEAILVCESLLGENTALVDKDVVRRFAQTYHAGEPIEVSDSVFAAMAYRGNVKGVLVLARIPEHNLASVPLGTPPLVVVACGLEKPGNLGALLRVADAVGVDVVLVCEGGADLYNPNVIRSSLGAFFAVETLTTSSQKAAAWLRENEITIIAAHPAAVADYRQVNYCSPVALLFGEEKHGIPSVWRPHIRDSVRIPMLGKMDSLNVSCSGAVLLYEVLTQRERPGN